MTERSLFPVIEEIDEDEIDDDDEIDDKNEDEINDKNEDGDDGNNNTLNPVETVDTIFVSIASYRDPECVNTLIDLFTQALHPDRIFVGVCEQNAPEDQCCLDSQQLEPYLNQIRILQLSHFDARGPMYARSLIEQELYENEMYYLQLDSHMLMVPEWDRILIEQLISCPSTKPILTTYPHDFDRQTRQHVVLPNGQRQLLGTVPPTFIRFREFHPKLKFTEQEKHIFAHTPYQPVPILFWAAGFSFSLGELVRQVPYDGNCHFVFVGEEQSMAMRYFTHGWDFFAPGVNIVYHLLKRTYRPVFWEQVYRRNCVVDNLTRAERKKMEYLGVLRVRYMISGALDSNDEEEVYGLGNERSTQEWQEFTGVDLAQHSAIDRSFLGLSPHYQDFEAWCKHGSTHPQMHEPTLRMQGLVKLNSKQNVVKQRHAFVPKQSISSKQMSNRKPYSNTSTHMAKSTNRTGQHPILRGFPITNTINTINTITTTTTQIQPVRFSAGFL